MAVDYEKELNNGWSKWQNLVLQTQAETKADLKELHAEMATLTTNVALLAQAAKGQEDYGPRIVALEQNVVTNDTLRNDRRWLLATGIALIGSIIIPAVVVIAGVAGL